MRFNGVSYGKLKTPLKVNGNLKMTTEIVQWSIVNFSGSILKPWKQSIFYHQKYWRRDLLRMYMQNIFRSFEGFSKGSTHNSSRQGHSITCCFVCSFKSPSSQPAENNSWFQVSYLPTTFFSLKTALTRSESSRTAGFSGSYLSPSEAMLPLRFEVFVIVCCTLLFATVNCEPFSMCLSDSTFGRRGGEDGLRFRLNDCRWILLFCSQYWFLVWLLWACKPAIFSCGTSGCCARGRFIFSLYTFRIFASFSLRNGWGSYQYG